MPYRFVSFSGHPVPLLGPENYKSYSVLAPPRTHWRKATCEEYECEDWLYGFVTTVNISTELGQKQYHFLTHDKKRKYTMQRLNMELVKFVYGPGNMCMRWDEHMVPLGRPPRLYVIGGDWRGNPRGTVVRHTRIEHWVEDFGEHQEKLADTSMKG